MDSEIRTANFFMDIFKMKEGDSIAIPQNAFLRWADHESALPYLVWIYRRHYDVYSFNVSGRLDTAQWERVDLFLPDTARPGMSIHVVKTITPECIYVMG